MMPTPREIIIRHEAAMFRDIAADCRARVAPGRPLVNLILRARAWQAARFADHLEAQLAEPRKK